jgi:N-acetyl-gamma-glutamylphosphate reductase
MTAGIMTIFPPNAGVGQQTVPSLLQPATQVRKDSLITEIKLKDKSIDKKIEKLSLQIEQLKRENKKQALQLKEKDNTIACLHHENASSAPTTVSGQDTMKAVRKTNFFKNLFNRKKQNSNQ